MIPTGLFPGLIGIIRHQIVMRRIFSRIALLTLILMLGLLLGILFAPLSQKAARGVYEGAEGEWLEYRLQIKGIYIALRKFQETQEYNNRVDASNGEWLIYNDRADQSLYRLLTDLGNAPVGGYLLHVPEESVQDEVFVNPWGKPYVAVIYVPENAQVADMLVESGFARGKKGSILFVFSELEFGGYGMFFMDEGIPPE